MKKKFAILNFILMLSVLFAVSYQSLHAFSHHKHKEINSISSEKTFTQNLLEKEHCPVCDFKFASFLSPEVFTYSLFIPFYKIPYQFDKKEFFLIFEGSAHYLRGPPALV